VIVDNFYILRTGRIARPLEADPPLIINAYAELAAPVAPQCRKEVSWQSCQILIDVAASNRSSLIWALRSKPENALTLLPSAKSSVRLSR